MKSLLRTSFMIVVLLLFSINGWAQTPPSLEERLLKMEEEINRLKERNSALEQEVEKLRAQVNVVEEVTSDMKSADEYAEILSANEAAKPEINVSYRKGLNVETSDDSFRFKLGGRITTRFTGLDSGHPSNNEFSLERARIETEVTLLEHYDLRIQTELAESPKLKDGYLNINYVPWAELEIGQFKPPFTWENLFSHKYLDFADRSIAINNIRNPSRDVGLMFHGEFCDDRLQYQLAILNGSGENKGDDNDAKDIAARLVLEPFSNQKDRLFSKLHLGVSGTFGNQEKDFSSESFKTTAGTSFVDFADDTMHTGDRLRLGTEALLPIGPASIKAEWTHMRLDDFELDSMRDDFDFYAWYISGSYLLTGEQKTLGRVSPKRPFDPSAGAWGAWEVAARYSVFDSDDDLFDLGMATGTDKAEAYTIGLNWYLNEYLRVIFDYERTEFDDAVSVDDKMLDNEDAFLVQCQLEF